MKPLADLIRPKQLSEVFGQEHILGENKILDRIVKSGRISNMIFYICHYIYTKLRKIYNII